MSKALAKAAADRDAYQHKLSQQTMVQRGTEERLAESDRLMGARPLPH